MLILSIAFHNTSECWNFFFCLIGWLNESWGLSQLPIQRCQVLFATPTDSWDIFMGLAAIAQNLWDDSSCLEQQLEFEQKCTWSGICRLSILGPFILPLPGEIQFKIRTASFKCLQIDVYLCFWCLRFSCNRSRLESQLSCLNVISNGTRHLVHPTPTFPLAATPKVYVISRSCMSYVLG